MQQFQEFVIGHPYLWSALLVVLVAFAVNELVRSLRGGRPISAAEAVRLINSEDAIVVDTRSASEYKKNHILNAVHVPLAGIEERAHEITKRTDRTIICYCGTGNTAPQATAKLRKKGYAHVHALKGGINAWQADGLPLTSK
jgi:rhodanese-related sulfurtransferase